MQYANGKEAKPGDHIVGRDCGGNLITGPVMMTGLRGDNFRVAGVPLVVPAADCLLCEDAYLIAMAPIEAERKAKAEAEAKALQEAEAAAAAAAAKAPATTPAPPSNPS